MGPPITAVHMQPEPYRHGFARGFYGSSVDPPRCALGRLDDILRHGSRDESDRQFVCGYRAGRQARNATIVAAVADTIDNERFSGTL